MQQPVGGKVDPEPDQGEDDEGREYDRMNLATLRRLARAACR